MQVALAVLLVLATSPGEKERSRELAHRSIREYDVGQFDAALRDMQEAYLADPVPELLFNLGQCHRALEHWREAARMYRNYLRYRPGAANRQAVEKIIREVEAKQAQVRSQETRPAPSGQTVRPAAPPEPVPPADAPLAVHPPLAPPTTAPVPDPWAEAAAPAPPHRGHGVAIALGVAALVAAGVSIWGWSSVWSFQSLEGQSHQSAGSVSAAGALSAQSGATAGEAVGITLAIAAVGLATGATLTW